MDCPACQTHNATGQKFCGTCGHKLEATCIRCGAPNPPHYKFCGQCGSSLASAGAVTLARSGLIAQVNQKALDMFGYHQKEMQGKPFSLFVEREDLVIFFTHMNELHSDAKQQSFEIKIKNAKAESIYVLLECRVDEDGSDGTDDVHIILTEVTDSRLASTQMQYLQDLLGLMFTVTESIRSVPQKHLGMAMEDALKKICLFAKADRCFIYGINHHLKLLEPTYHWHQPSSSASGGPKSRSIPLDVIKHIIVRLRREQNVVSQDLSQLTGTERQDLRAWHQIEFGAVLYHLIYWGKRPVGVMGLERIKADGEWTSECVALVKYFSQIVADILSNQNVKDDAAGKKAPSLGAPTPAGKIAKTDTGGKVIDISVKQPSHRKASESEQTGPKTQISPDTTRPMLLEKCTQRPTKDQQSVFPMDNGLIMLACPRCGLQESVSIDQFNRLGNAINVHCQCREQFTAVLEKRRSFRKAVQLEGYFSLKGDLGPIDANGSIWGPMVVKDLSKAGLRFASEKAALVHNGDLLMVRFNLDNTNRALIHKPARVMSVTNDEVGCLFEGSDSYDITLGFYFI